MSQTCYGSFTTTTMVQKRLAGTSVNSLCTLCILDNPPGKYDDKSVLWLDYGWWSPQREMNFSQVFDTVL